MALNRKYAALPDLDSAPDIYETPDLTDDNSTVPTGTQRSPSAQSDYQDFDDSPHISRSRLQPDSARAQFEPARIDAKDVDFSDRVNGKRKSYKVSSRLGDFSDEEDGDAEGDDSGEWLERRIARLRREVEEVKGEVERRKAQKGQKSEGDTEGVGKHGDEVEGLGRMLEGISAEDEGAIPGSATRLTKALASSVSASRPAKQVSDGPQKDGDAATYTVTYAPSFQEDHDQAKAAAFDTRLTLLERSLGITSTAIPSLDPKGVPVAILPSIDALQRQISVLLESTPASLDNISRRVRTLTAESERMEEAHRAAKAAKQDLRDAGGDPAKSSADDEDAEQASKINALYGTLSTIENLAPLLPSVLDRLRSLRTIHSDAAKAHESIEAAMKKQEEMGGEIKKWREGLEKVEEAMKNGDVTMGKNVETVEGWIKDLEQRMNKLGA